MAPLQGRRSHAASIFMRGLAFRWNLAARPGNSASASRHDLTHAIAAGRARLGRQRPMLCALKPGARLACAGRQGGAARDAVALHRQQARVPGRPGWEDAGPPALGLSWLAAELA